MLNMSTASIQWTMKSKGKMIAEDNGLYSLENLQGAGTQFTSRPTDVIILLCMSM